MTLTKDILVKYIQSETGFQANKCRLILDIILEEMKKSLQEGKAVKISGFGIWKVRNKKPRKARHPSTGELIHIDERSVISFYPSQKLRSFLNEHWQSYSI
ncbi:MAG: HU family DNA-binding protein [Deltaproteobacteria bacterium]|nr:HU family DNA-binding protein [Deltaproteobacteria bacterium]